VGSGPVLALAGGGDAGFFRMRTSVRVWWVTHHAVGAAVGGLRWVPGPRGVGVGVWLVRGVARRLVAASRSVGLPEQRRVIVSAVLRRGFWLGRAGCVWGSQRPGSRRRQTLRGGGTFVTCFARLACGLWGGRGLPAWRRGGVRLNRSGRGGVASFGTATRRVLARGTCSISLFLVLILSAGCGQRKV